MWMKVEPPARLAGKIEVAYVPAELVRRAELCSRLEAGPFDVEELLREQLAGPDGQGDEASFQAAHERATRGVVELLNIALDATGVEASAESTFGLVEEREDEEDEVRWCPACDEEMDRDCQGRPRCPACDEPCRDCHDGGMF